MSEDAVVSTSMWKPLAEKKSGLILISMVEGLWTPLWFILPLAFGRPASHHALGFCKSIEYLSHYFEQNSIVDNQSLQTRLVPQFYLHVSRTLQFFKTDTTGNLVPSQCWIAYIS